MALKSIITRQRNKEIKTKELDSMLEEQKNSLNINNVLLEEYKKELESTNKDLDNVVKENELLKKEKNNLIAIVDNLKIEVQRLQTKLRETDNEKKEKPLVFQAINDPSVRTYNGPFIPT